MDRATEVYPEPGGPVQISESPEIPLETGSGEPFRSRNVPMHADRPARPEEDAFGRAAFAPSQAQRHRSIWRDNNMAHTDTGTG